VSETNGVLVAVKLPVGSSIAAKRETEKSHLEAKNITYYILLYVMKDFIKMLFLYLKYFFKEKCDAMIKLHVHYREMELMACIYRAEYLYHKFIEQKPKIIKISLKDNDPEAPFRKQFHHISGFNFGFHYVVKLNDMIYDSNLFLNKPITETDYFKHVISYKNNNEIIKNEFRAKYTFGEVKRHLENTQYKNASKWD
ncbi:MAG: hypothetical protein ACOC32_03385, partial [Nanoarchaeota archaeon]